MTLSITITPPAPRPLGRLEGEVLWSGEQPPSGFEIRLFWETSGKGTQEASVVARGPLAFDGNGKAAFSFELPDSPYSFAGQLVSVIWAVEVVDSRGSAQAAQNFILSPDGTERQLGKVAKPQSKGSFITLHRQ